MDINPVKLSNKIRDSKTQLHSIAIVSDEVESHNQG